MPRTRLRGARPRMCSSEGKKPLATGRFSKKKKKPALPIHFHPSEIWKATKRATDESYRLRAQDDYIRTLVEPSSFFFFGLQPQSRNIDLWELPLYYQRMPSIQPPKKETPYLRSWHRKRKRTKKFFEQRAGG
jgi:hypothetical protein